MTTTITCAIHRAIDRDGNCPICAYTSQATTIARIQFNGEEYMRQSDFVYLMSKKSEEIYLIEQKLATAREALEFNVSKHNTWVDKGHWCDSKAVLQSIVDSSKAALEKLK